MTILKKSKYGNFLDKIWPFILIFTATYLLAQIQINNQHIILDIDTMFHYNRFNDIAQQIKTGHFSYFQTNFGFEQSGRIINALYGPFFAYFNGLLVVICGSWFNYQLFTYFILGMGAGSGMFLLCRQLEVPKNTAVILAILYLNIGSIQAWFDHTNLTAWGALFAPYVFMVGIKMIKDHNHPLPWVKLMLIMSLIGQTHLLSVLLLSLSLVPFVIVGFITSSNRKKFIFNLFLAVMGTLILTANVWGAILLIFSTNHLVPNLGHDLVLNALHLSKFGTIRSNLLLGTGIVLTIQIIYSLFNPKASFINKLVTIEGGVFFFISSCLFPWHFVQNKFGVLSSYLQFPHRFLIIAYPLLLLGIGLTITELNHKNKIYKPLLLTVLGIILLNNFGSNYNRISQASSPSYRAIYRLTSDKYYLYKDLYNQEKYYNYVFGLKGKYQANGIKNTKKGNIYIKVAARGDYYKNTTNLEEIWQITHQRKLRNQLFDAIIKVNPDYLPAYKPINATKADSYYIHSVIKPHLSQKYKYTVLSDGRLKISWFNKNKTKITLPLVLYHQSQLKLNGKLVHPTLNAIGTPTIQSKPGKNYAILQFITPLWFTLLLLISILSWLILIILGIKKIYDTYCMS